MMTLFKFLLTCAITSCLLELGGMWITKAAFPAVVKSLISNLRVWTLDSQSKFKRLQQCIVLSWTPTATWLYKFVYTPQSQNDILMFSWTYLWHITTEKSTPRGRIKTWKCVSLFCCVFKVSHCYISYPMCWRTYRLHLYCERSQPRCEQRSPTYQNHHGLGAVKCLSYQHTHALIIPAWTNVYVTKTTVGPRVSTPF